MVLIYHFEEHEELGAPASELPPVLSLRMALARFGEPTQESTGGSRQR